MPPRTPEEEIARFDPSVPLDEASTPPSAWYTDPGVYALERSRVFGRSWLAAAREDQLRSPGDWVADETAGERYLVSRDATGSLHAFVNVCRHRASAVAQGCGRAERLVCPYHGWTYALDGRLLGAPDLGAVKGFERERSGLLPLSSAAWGPFVFVSRSPRPRPLQEELAPLASRLESSGYASLRFAARRTYELACNWKVFVDNYLDGGYHVPLLHRGLAAQLDLSSYRTEIFERFSIQSSAGSAPDARPASPGAGTDFAERIGGGAIYAWIYPSFMINRYGPMMDTNWVVPLAPDRTRVHMDYYFEETEGERAREFIERSLAASDVVQREDIGICESVQQGLASSSFESGRYSVKRQAGEHHFHRLLAADLRTPAE
ncbi:MAG TPA: aromatic ring-hydroxylating dioxygenase subunit alpha [Candidatus Saccharimonadales bacterium]|nr:aromatic ring-hydroxylating dioxygenase subunit alpha [Candidatus Saccharimonadales bacterium]